MSSEPTFSRFSNQVAVVTGAADGLGRAIAIRLLSEGAVVWFFDRDREAVERTAVAAGVSARPLSVDITDDEAVQKAFATVMARDGRLDIVVNSAGIVGPNNRPLDATPLEGFAEVVRVNLVGSFIVARHALKHMVPGKYGRVLLIASIAGKDGNAGMCGYSASKAGVIGLTKSAGKEYAETGITINALAPAVIRTAMVDRMEDTQVRYMTDKIPMKRCATLEEVASIATWIVSPEASFNTGFTFDLSGGRAVY